MPRTPVPLDLDLARIPMPPLEVLEKAALLDAREREIVTTLARNFNLIQRYNNGLDNRPFRVSPHSPRHFEIGPGAIKSLVRMGLLDPCGDDEWKANDAAMAVAYALTVESSVKHLCDWGTRLFQDGPNDEPEEEAAPAP